MIFVFAILVWLLINYITWWIQFNTALCFFVGLFLIMPILLKIDMKAVKEIFSKKHILYINLLLNFVLIPLLAFVVWYLFFGLENYGFIISLILVSIIPWWGLLMSWLQNTKSNMHIGFILFAINLLVFSLFYIWFNFWTEYFVEHYTKKENVQSTQILKNIVPTNNSNLLNYSNNSQFLWNNLVQKEKPSGCAIQQVSAKLWISAPSCFEKKSTMIYGFFGFIALILIPFIVSRIILFFFGKNETIFKYAPIFSKISAFILISYIFSLNYIRWLFEVNVSLLIKISLAVVVFYILLYFLIKLVLKFVKLDEDIKKSIFWNSFTRFLTLSLILSFLYAVVWKQPEIILIPIISYFVQIWAATVLAKQSKN